jgi:hypothetical protein
MGREVVVAVTNGRLDGSIERSTELTPRARRSLWHMGAGCIFGLSTSFAPVAVLDLHRSLVLIRPVILVAGHR